LRHCGGICARPPAAPRWSSRREQACDGISTFGRTSAASAFEPNGNSNGNGNGNGMQMLKPSGGSLASRSAIAKQDFYPVVVTS